MIKSKFLLIVLVFLTSFEQQAFANQTPITDINDARVISAAPVITSFPDDNYWVILYKPDEINEDSVLVRVYKRKALTLPGVSTLDEDNLRFFVVLPDGNFIYLNFEAKNPDGHYIRKVKFQFRDGDLIHNTNNLQAWLLKKNDPTLPPASNRIAPGKFDQKSGVLDSYSAENSDFYSVMGHTNADSYLSPTEQIKIGTSWSPWPAAEAYYFLVVSYTNRNVDTINNILSGVVVVDTCGADNTGYQIESYQYLNPVNQQWVNVVLPNNLTSPNFPIVVNFLGLKKGEVRHIYLKLKRVGNETLNSKAMYKASLFDSEFIQDKRPVSYSGCLEIPLTTNPHDPNDKIADQKECLANGNGLVTYTINFQNEGRGFARDVIITDTLPPAFGPNYNINFIGSSHGCSYTLSASGVLEFSLNNIGLPGTEQTAPRVFDHSQTKGWVRFSTQGTCPAVGDTIKNKAAIVFVGDDGEAQPPVITEDSNILSVKQGPKGWDLPACPCLPKKQCCIGWGRCRWCWYKTCKPKPIK